MDEASSLHYYLDGLGKYAPSISIIYAEDDPLIREQLVKLLSRFFVDARIASDGKEALDFYNNRRCDILITDIVMPNMSGLELCTNIREQHPDQKIIIISAHSDSERLIDLINIGVDKFMLKPIDNKMFIRRLFAICRELYEHKQVDILHSQLEENLASLQKIIEMMYDAIVIVEGNKITRVNRRFLDIANSVSLEDFLSRTDRIDSVFVRAKGYVSNCSNEELIDLCKLGDTVRAVINSENGAHVVLITHSQLNDKTAILTFSDITSLEKELLVAKKKLQTNPITNISNKSAFIEKLADTLSTTDCTLILVVFARYAQQLKLYGKETVISAERLFVDATKHMLESAGIGDKVYFANYDKNAFVLTCDKKYIQQVTSKIFDKEIALTSENPKNQITQIVKFSTVIKTLEFSKTQNIDDYIHQIETEFANMNQ